MSYAFSLIFTIVYQFSQAKATWWENNWCKCVLVKLPWRLGATSWDRMYRKIKNVDKLITKFTEAHEHRLHHVNVETIQLLDITTLVRRTSRQNLMNIKSIISEEAYPNISDASINVTRILTSKVKLNGTDDFTIPSYFYSNDTDVPDEDYVDFSTLHPDEAKELYNIALRKTSMAEMELNKTIDRRSPLNRIEEAFFYNEFFFNKAIDLMTHSVYATRYRLRDTQPLRKKMYKFLEYDAALKYGSLMQLRIKMSNLFTTMKKLNPRDVRSIWYLVLYERCLAMSTDVGQMVKEIFAVHQRFLNLKHVPDDD